MRKNINRSLCRLPSRYRKTITYENGVENVEHEWVNRVLGTKSFFYNPYTSQERCTVENIAGLVRRQVLNKTTPRYQAVKLLKKLKNNCRLDEYSTE